MIYPPVLVPPIKSKYSHGFGGFFGFIIFIKYLRMISVEIPRIPPPSSKELANHAKRPRVIQLTQREEL